MINRNAFFLKIKMMNACTVFGWMFSASLKIPSMTVIVFFLQFFCQQNHESQLKDDTNSNILFSNIYIYIYVSGFCLLICLLTLFSIVWYYMASFLNFSAKFYYIFMFFLKVCSTLPIPKCWFYWFLNCFYMSVSLVYSVPNVNH